MNLNDEKEKAVVEYAKKHSCSTAAARVAMGQVLASQQTPKPRVTQVEPVTFEEAEDLDDEEENDDE